MPKLPEDTDLNSWHRYFAMDCNNRAWNLSIQERTSRQDQDMLDAAHASAFHWNSFGTELNRMRSRMLLAEVYSLLGMADPAMSCADEVRGYFTGRDTPDWEVALVHAIHAHAAAVAGNAEAHRASYAEARRAIDAIADEEDRRIVRETFEHVPSP